jgi:hypothetical protein
MLIAPDRFYWPKLYSAMMTYIGTYLGKSNIGLHLGICDFYRGEFWYKTYCVKSVIKNPKKFLSAGPIEVFIFTLILAGDNCPDVFYPKGNSLEHNPVFVLFLFLAVLLREFWVKVKNQS